MKTFVSIECSRCRKEIKSDENAYCSECLGGRDGELLSLDRIIKIQEERIRTLEKELKNGNK